MSAKTGVIEGKDLMLYINKGTKELPQWKPTAMATSHKVSFKAETKDRKTKESGKWAEKVVTMFSVSISVEALQSYDAEISLKEFKALAKAGEPVMCKYGYVTETTDDTYEQGYFIITSIEETSAAGEDATYSATLDSSGEVETKTVPRELRETLQAELDTQAQSKSRKTTSTNE